MFQNIPTAWTVEENAFPRDGSDAEKLRFLLNYAVLAPSSHNAQPWRFLCSENEVALYADRTRALHATDPLDRELTMSCGAALFLLRIAIRHFGHTDEVVTLPDPEQPDLMARIRLGNARLPSEEEESLFAAIRKRHTNRHGFSTLPVVPGLVEGWQLAARTEGVSLEAVQDPTVQEALADLIAEADRDQLADPAFRRELARWIRNGEEGDGIPAEALGMPGLISYATPFLVRMFDTGPLVAAHDHQLTEGAPTLVVFVTDADTPRQWLQTGQALARFLLLATVNGVSASFLNAPIEISHLRERVRDVLHIDGYPQLLLRAGYGPEVTPTPRRPLEAVCAEAE